MREASAKVSADFLTASTPEGLRRSILELQMTLGGQVKIISITYAEKLWVCWYYNDMDDLLMTEALRKKRG
jgi:hypothetical protein